MNTAERKYLLQAAVKVPSTFVAKNGIAKRHPKALPLRTFAFTTFTWVETSPHVFVVTT